MKKIVFFLLASTLMAACSKDENRAIPMETLEGGFKEYILQNFDLNNDGLISVEEASLVTEMNANTQNISSLAGIQFFPNLENLYCSNNYLREMDVSQNPKLKILECDHCYIEELDVSNNHELETLSCSYQYGGGLKSIKLNPELKRLYMDDHRMALLDFSGNQHLKELLCGGENLVHLDVSRSVLEDINYSRSNQTTINLEGCTVLKKLTYSGNGYNVDYSPDLANCPNLEELDVKNIFSLDVSHSLRLSKLYCRASRLENLDLTSNASLADFVLKDVIIEKIDFGRNSQLVDFEMDGSSIISNLDFSNYKSLKSISINHRSDYSTIPNFEDMNLTGCTALETVKITGAWIQSLNLTGCVALSELSCDHGLTELILKGCTHLEKLSCRWSNLSELDVNDCINLSSIICNDNQLTEIKVSNPLKLKELICTNNNIASLDLSGCNSLEVLECNNLTAPLNIVDCVTLKTLKCQNSSLTSLDVALCTGLTSLDCSGNNLQPSLDVSNNTALTSLDCRNNNLLKELLVKRTNSIQTLLKDTETQIVLVD